MQRSPEACRTRWKILAKDLRKFTKEEEDLLKGLLDEYDFPIYLLYTSHYYSQLLTRSFCLLGSNPNYMKSARRRCANHQKKSVTRSPFLENQDQRKNLKPPPNPLCDIGRAGIIDIGSFGGRDLIVTMTLWTSLRHQRRDFDAGSARAGSGEEASGASSTADEI